MHLVVVSTNVWCSPVKLSINFFPKGKEKGCSVVKKNGKGVSFEIRGIWNWYLYSPNSMQKSKGLDLWV